MALKAPTPRGPSVTRVPWLVLGGSAVLLAFWRSRAFLVHGRFWAEECTVFLPEMAARSFGRGLGFVFNGHLELFTNVLMWLASRVPFTQAPRLSTLGSLALALFVLAFLGWEWRRADFSPVTFAPVLLAFFAIPESSETWANAVNLHFYGAIAAWIVLINPRRSWTARVVLFLAGLSGLPACLLFPIFFWRAWRERAHELVVRCTVFAAPVALQAALLVVHGGGGRQIQWHPIEEARAIMTHLVLVPLLGARADAAASGLDGPTSPLFMFCALWLCCLVAFVLRSGRREARLTLAASAILLFGSLAAPHGDVGTFASLLGGARYFYAPSFLLFIALILSLEAKPQWPPLLRLVSLGVTVVLVGQIVRWGIGDNQQGPSWPEALERARVRGTAEVEIWPAGWTCLVADSVEHVKKGSPAD